MLLGQLLGQGPIQARARCIARACSETLVGNEVDYAFWFFFFEKFFYHFDYGRKYLRSTSGPCGIGAGACLVLQRKYDRPDSFALVCDMPCACDAHGIVKFACIACIEGAFPMLARG